MYRVAVDKAAQDDITAAVAAHRELGRDYDEAVAESLVDRIGAEIDKRVDARLRADSSGSRAPAAFPRSGGSQALWTGVAIGAALTGFMAMLGNHGPHGAVEKAVVVAWLILVVAGLGTALVRRYQHLSRQLRGSRVGAAREPRADHYR
jgi:hypothetical protein